MAVTISVDTSRRGAPPASTAWIMSLSEHWPSSTAFARTCWQAAADWPATTISRLRFSASKNFFSIPMIWGVVVQDTPVEAHLIAVIWVSLPVAAEGFGAGAAGAAQATDTRDKTRVPALTSTAHGRGPSF